MINIGDRIYWNCIHGEISGIVEEIRDNDYFFVCLDSGKCVLVNELSITKWGK